jgi:hypothetical protein
MNKKYEYLEQYINAEGSGMSNWFRPVTKDEILDAEKQIGFELPQSLKEFWLEIGYGRLFNNITGIDAGNSNLILHPDMVTNLIIKDKENAIALWEILEEFNEDDIPFFEVGNSDCFLMMKRNAKYPDGVYDNLGHLVDASFERFIWRLYHESPDFYFARYQIPDAANDN